MINRAESELVSALVVDFRLNRLSVDMLGEPESKEEETSKQATPELSQRLKRFIQARAKEIEEAELRRLFSAR